MAAWSESCVRSTKCIVVLLGLAVTSAWAQQAPSTQDGPMSVARDLPPGKPYSDGSYPMGPGITAPKIVEAVPAVYPADTPLEDAGATCELSVVIDSAGAVGSVRVFFSAGDAFNASAIEAVKQSKFAPGSWDGQAIAVRIHVRVHFSQDLSPATPAVVDRASRGPGSLSARMAPPVPIHTAEPEYSDEARRKKIQGIVIVSLLVTTDGLPTDIRVERSLGHGLDEKALETAGQYRFKPAMKDGVPVATRISIEMNFKLY